MKLTPAHLRRLLSTLVETQSREIGCDACYAELARFAEMTLSGRSACDAMPLVHWHLVRCRDCREEFEALLAALDGEGEGLFHAVRIELEALRPTLNRVRPNGVAVVSTGPVTQSGA